MSNRKIDIIEKWMNINYPDVLNNPVKHGSCCMFKSKCGSETFFIHLYDAFPQDLDYKDFVKNSIILNNEFESFFLGTFGKNFKKYLLIWLESKLKICLSNII